MDYTAVGQTTHVAARMEQMAPPGSILVSAATVALAEGYVEAKPLGPLPVRGLEASLEVYELTRAATIRSRFQAAAPAVLTASWGASPNWTTSARALARVRAGHGQVVAVVGEPGVGKSRLVLGVQPIPPRPGLADLESGSVSYGKATNYLPIIELLRAYFAIEPSDTPGRYARKSPASSCRSTGSSSPRSRRSFGCSTFRSRTSPGASRRAPAPTADSRRGQAPVAAREPGTAADGSVRGPPLDRRRDPGPPGQPGGGPAHGAGTAARELPARVRPRLGGQDLLPAASDRSPAARERRCLAERAAGARRELAPSSGS